MLVKHIYDIFSYIHCLPPHTDLIDIDRKDANYDIGFTKRELECTLLLITGQLMMELSRLNVNIRIGQAEALKYQFNQLQFDDYTKRIFCWLIDSVEDTPFLIEGDRWTNVHHGVTVLHAIADYRNRADDEIKRETIHFYRTLIKLYMVLNTTLTDSLGVIHGGNRELFFPTLCMVNNYAVKDYYYHEGELMPGRVNLAEDIDFRLQYIEHRFLHSLFSERLFNKPVEAMKDNWADCLLADLGVLDKEDHSVVTELPEQPPEVDSDCLNNIVKNLPMYTLYNFIETVARFIDWNREKVKGGVWKNIEDNVLDALMLRMKHG